LLDVRNRVLASYIGDAWQAGDLNRLAKTLADRVNGLLLGGVVSSGAPPQPGIALFSYEAGETNTARTITVDRSVVKPELLAAIEPGPPPVANGVPLALAGLAGPTNAADEIDGSSYSEYYGTLAARAGTGVQEANGRLAVQQSAVAQAKNLRQQMSGVSLDEEATILIQFQRAYEANSRLISVLDQMSREAIDILQR
jgi:flagellar hook-associated protein 1 FlgK